MIKMWETDLELFLGMSYFLTLVISTLSVGDWPESWRVFGPSYRPKIVGWLQERCRQIVGTLLLCVSKTKMIKNGPW